MANLKVSIIERLKTADGGWTSKPVDIPKQRPNAKGLYMRDMREGKFLLVWRESGRKRYSDYIASLPQALREKAQKELFLKSLSEGLKVEDPHENVRLTIAEAIDKFLSELTGRGNTVATYVQNLRQFETWNQTAKTRKTYVDQLDRAHVFAFKKFVESTGCDEYTAVWKCIRLNKMVKTVLNLQAGQGPVKKSDFSDILNRKPTVTTYNKDERDKYLACCKGTKLVIWTLALKCGLRLKEISHLEWADVDFAAHVIHIRRKQVKDGDKVVDFVPKKWSIRDVAIPADLLALLQGQLKRKLANSNLCFPTFTGRINTKLWDSCKGIARRAGVDVAKFMPKNFRSTYATNRLRSGYELPELRDQMGHRDMHSVEHYLAAMKSEELLQSGKADAGWD
ncbi:MAG: site-specific integrase [Candidatus Korobacteraceae bacterium]|jgi:integrase